MITTTLHLSFPHPPSFHSLACGACSHHQHLFLSHLTFPTLHISKNPPLHRLRRSSPIAMSSDSGRSSSPAIQPPPMELNDESDFETIVSPDGYISICGFGSLLSGTYNLPHRRRCVDEFFVVLMSLMFAGSREKREEYVSGTDQLQRVAVERLPASVCSHGSHFLRAWHCQA